MQKINFGTTVKDVVTGFCGVVTGFTTYMTGCSQYLVQPPVDEKGSRREGVWIDEARLVDQHARLVTLPGRAAKPDAGADIPAPIR